MRNKREKNNQRKWEKREKKKREGIMRKCEKKLPSLLLQEWPTRTSSLWLPFLCRRRRMENLHSVSLILPRSPFGFSPCHSSFFIDDLTKKSHFPQVQFCTNLELVGLPSFYLNRPFGFSVYPRIFLPFFNSFGFFSLFFFFFFLKRITMLNLNQTRN